MDDHPSSTSSSTTSPRPAPQSSSSQPAARPLYSSKLSDQKSQSRPAADDSSSTPSQANRQAAPPQKAWTDAKSPITGRPHLPRTGSSVSTKESTTASLQEGQNVHFTLTTGAEFEGVYAINPADASRCYLKMVQQKKGPNSTDTPGGLVKRDFMSFQKKDVADARPVSNNNGKTDGRSANGSRTGFRTDAAISNTRGGIGRDLQRWEPDTKDDGSLTLEKSAGQTGQWDQFATNERLFGIKSDYDENIYTTEIDKAHPNFQQRVALADRKAKEIERSVATTSHVAEERVMDFAGGDDERNEEDKYSGVRRQDFPPLQSRENKYTPPARRAPTGHATVKGAPVDPAIISSQLKASTPKPVAKSEENKTVPPQAKPSTAPASEVKIVEAKPDAKSESKAPENAPQATKPGPDNKSTATAPLKPSTATSETVSPQTSQADTPVAPSAAATVEKDVLSSFRSFASHERSMHQQARQNKTRQDAQLKLQELKKFGANFKLSTPVPNDLISIIAKDPEKQKKIQEKAKQDAEEVAKTKADGAASATTKPTQAPAAKESQSKAPTPTASAAATPAPAVDSRSTSRPTAPQHSSSPSAVPGRHPGARQSYGAQPHYQQSYRGNRQNSHMGGQQPPQTGGLAQRIRDNKMLVSQHQHMNQHTPVDNMRLPPTGPANGVDQPYVRRLSNFAPAHLQPKLNPNSHEFRPNAFAPVFNPAGPSQASSPRSVINSIVDPAAVHIGAARGQLIRRKTKGVNAKKCEILAHLKTLKPPPGQNWDENLGLRNSFQTPATWRQAQEDNKEPAGSTMRLTYNQYFEQLPNASAAAATPSLPHMAPVVPHHQQLPFDLQRGANMPPRQSPHMAAMQMHNGQHGPMAHGPAYNGHPDDHRMMQSNSSQSFASPRMAHQVPMGYVHNMNQPAQMQPPYMQQQMQPQMQPYGAPPMNPVYRSFSSNPQFMPQQQPHMQGPMAVQPGYMAPNGMAQAGPPMAMYQGPGPQQFMPQGTGPSSVAGSNGFPSPGRPAAPMMASHGSQQGQQMMYGMGMSPGPQYPQMYYQQGPKQYQGQRP